MSGLFGTPSFPTPPKIDDPEIQKEKQRQLAARLAGAGRQSTILTGGGGITSQPMGSAASLLGGAV